MVLLINDLKFLGCIQTSVTCKIWNKLFSQMFVYPLIKNEGYFLFGTYSIGYEVFSIRQDQTINAPNSWVLFHHLITGFEQSKKCFIHSWSMLKDYVSSLICKLWFEQFRNTYGSLMCLLML